ncbi:MAG TPA: aminotransferase class IV [Verrucomicrobiae bacterium]|nr:aminotransferase class IV [Verrucomicrobiae bacterium]
MKIVFLNGQFLPEAQAAVSVHDRGFLLGDGLFETIRIVRGKPFRLAQHWERLARGAEFLKIPLPLTATELEQFVRQLIEQNQMADAILRLTLTRGAGGRGYTPPAGSPPTLVMALYDRPAPPPRAWHLVTASFRVSAADPLAAFKTTSKIGHVMARAEAVGQGADDALLLNTHGEVAETAGGNLFWVEADRPGTAPAGRGLLPGITRAVVLEICRALGRPVNERIIPPQALAQASGLFVTQSALGIVPVATLDGRPVEPSPLVEEIARAYAELLSRS